MAECFDAIMAFVSTQLGASILLAAVVMGAVMGATSYCIYAERKIAAFVQDRRGPNRVGPAGLIQPIADGIKMVMKEDVLSWHVDRPLFLLAPAITLGAALAGMAAIPWGGQLQLGDGTLINIQVATFDIGLLYILGIASMSIYGVVLGGWASNNKYSFFGAMRATAQMLSYEIPLGICVLVIVLTMGTLRLEEMAIQQAQPGLWGFLSWNVFLHPIAFVILFVTALAEANRTPFDLAEAEQELIGGFHTEYSALKFGMFFLGEYAHMITASALISVMFLGGWHFPWLSWTQPDAVGWIAVLAKVGVLVAKICGFIFVMILVRWTLPRFRFDQLMRLAWKGMIPVSLSLLVLTVGLVYFQVHRSIVWALGGNALILVVTLIIAGRSKVPVSGRQANMGPIPIDRIAPA